jgi:flavin-dependent dehydrogenase
VSEISNGDARNPRDAEGQATPPWDVIVIGAGPGGSSSAATLAKGGARVLVLEREEFPRFHVGESLLPDIETIIRLLDIELDHEVFIHKGGAQFLCEETGRTESFDFAEALPGPPRHAWHVDRPKFDTLLRDGAVAAGAVVRHGISVEEVEIEDEGVCVQFEGGQEIGRYLIDATGLDRFLAKKMKSGRPYEKFGKAAAFTHFSNLSEDTLGEFAPNNDVRIIVVPDGWLWAIPMTGDRLSIGFVSRVPGLRKQHLHDYLEQSPLFQRLLVGATHGETRLMGNFSFENVQSTGARFACVGDAACFIDPVFSSGVSLAIHRGIETANCLLPALAQGREADPDLMEPMKSTMQRAYDTFAGLVYRFYNTNFVDNIIFGAPKDGQFRDGVISVLAGDVFREDNPFQEMLLRSKRHSIRSSDPGKDQNQGPGASVSQ